MVKVEKAILDPFASGDNGIVKNEERGWRTRNCEIVFEAGEN